jgi:hypothetical protein
MGIERVPDLAGFAAANGHDGKSDDEIRAESRGQISKAYLPLDWLDRALIAHQQGDHLVVDALGAPHVGERAVRGLNK